MTKAELEKIKNHIDNIPTIAPIYVPELIAGLEEVLSDVARYKEEAWAWCCVANERALAAASARDEVELLRAEVRKQVFGSRVVFDRDVVERAQGIENESVVDEDQP